MKTQIEIEKEIEELKSSKENPIELIEDMNKNLLKKNKNNPSWYAYCYLENLKNCSEENRRIDKEIEFLQALFQQSKEFGERIKKIFKRELKSQTVGTDTIDKIEELKSSIIGDEELK